ncbi:hypothetical protein [Mycobacterium basiliense]|nr:hypothetical protein [Mycobacterium basiliense]
MSTSLRRCAAIGALGFALASLPVIGLGTPAIGRADINQCPPGWWWNDTLQRCALNPGPSTLPSAGPPAPGTPGGVYGPGGWGGPGGPGGPPAPGEPYGPYGPQVGAPGTPGWPGTMSGPSPTAGHGAMGHR